MAFQRHIRLPGSDRAPLPGAVLEGPADPDQQVQVTVFVRRRTDALSMLDRLNRITLHHPRFSPDQLAARHSTDPSDIDRITSLATQNNLQVVSADALSRRVQLSGTVAQLQAFFGTELGLYRRQAGTYRGRIGPVRIPSEIGDAVEAVLGLDDRPQAQPHIAIPELTPAAVTALSPAQVARLYNFPTGVTGQNQCIGIIELGGGFLPADLDLFFAESGVPVPSVTAVYVDGAANAPSSPPSVADIETALDIQVAAGVAPGARIAVYFAPNTDRGFLDAITTAIHDTTNRPSIISISWGSAERNWTQQTMQAMEQGIRRCCRARSDGALHLRRQRFRRLCQ